MPELVAILVAEGPSDVRRIRALVESVAAEATPSGVVPVVRLLAVEGHEGATWVKSIPKLARERGLRFRGDFSGSGDARNLGLVMQLLQIHRTAAPGRALIWARDTDGDEARRTAAEAFRHTHSPSVPLLLAIAHACGEAWIVAGFSPETKTHREVLQDRRKQWGFQPQLEPERLAHTEGAPKSAKHLVKELFDDDREAEHHALCAAARARHTAGDACGLNPFVQEVERWIREQPAVATHP